MVEHSRSDLIRIRGARQNNLASVDLDIPKRQLVVFSGVSGSGKSSLVFGTVAAEAQRLINETYSAFLQGFMANTARPDVDLLEGLTAAIAVDQERIGGDVRSTVGTVTDANAMLRIVFSRLGEPHAGPPSAFSFNVPSVSGRGAITIERDGEEVREVRSFERTGGMCSTCDGRGTRSDIDVEVVLDLDRSLAGGALWGIPGYTEGGWGDRLYLASGFLDPDKPIRDYTDQERFDLLERDDGTKIEIDGINRTYVGLLPKLRTSMFAKERESLQPHIRRFVDAASALVDCPACGGTRLAEHARRSLVDGTSIADACAMQVSDLAEWVRGLDAPSVAPLLEALQETLDAFSTIGLGYLSLDRASGTLSGGEAQRVKVIRHLGSALTDVTYVFDEPTVGLHAHDVARMVELLGQLRDKGNTVLVVEHEPAVILAADHVVDMGPGAGAAGGQVVHTGDVASLRAAATHTAEHLEQRAPVRSAVREATGHLEVRGASTHNLRDVDVDVPLGVLVVVTGVAGSGKSSLVDRHVVPAAKRAEARGAEAPGDEASGDEALVGGVAVVDQSPIRGSRRSNPATYTGIFDDVRKAFAKANGVKPALFSFNSDGACPGCNGLGVVETQLGVMASVESTCEVCEGARFAPEVLELELQGKSIGDVLAMSVEQALEFCTELSFARRQVLPTLTSLRDVGLGYLALGQALNTLSGGERQRLRLAIEMAGDAGMFVLDEPTTGLHMADVDRLVGLLDRLVDDGRSVLVVEHDLDVVARADWVIDLGPGAGHEGGEVVFSGPPAALLEDETSLTGRHLADGRVVETS